MCQEIHLWMARVEKGKQDALDKWDISKDVLGTSIDKLNALLWWD